MNADVLLGLAAKWERAADRAPAAEDGSPTAQVKAAQARGRRIGIKECAENLRALVKLLG